jgi:hypothetical protein
MEKHEATIHKFYNCEYLKNRYPSANYIFTCFFYPESPDLVAVALGYKPSVLLSAEELKSEFNDHYATRCYYRGKELCYLDENSVVICDKDDKEKFCAIFNKDNTDKEWGTLLGYPEHLVDLFVECTKEKYLDWTTYNTQAEEIALKIAFNL